MAETETKAQRRTVVLDDESRLKYVREDVKTRNVREDAKTQI